LHQEGIIRDENALFDARSFCSRPAFQPVFSIRVISLENDRTRVFNTGILFTQDSKAWMQSKPLLSFLN
jgi:hypothetical protein